MHIFSPKSPTHFISSHHLFLFYQGRLVNLLALGQDRLNYLVGYVQIQESIRGCDVFLIQPTCAPVNDHLMELLIMVDACRRASARQITAVVPYCTSDDLS